MILFSYSLEKLVDVLREQIMQITRHMETTRPGRKSLTFKRLQAELNSNAPWQHVRTSHKGNSIFVSYHNGAYCETFEQYFNTTYWVVVSPTGWVLEYSVDPWGCL